MEKNDFLKLTYVIRVRVFLRRFLSGNGVAERLWTLKRKKKIGKLAQHPSNAYVKHFSDRFFFLFSVQRRSATPFPFKNPRKETLARTRQFNPQKSFFFWQMDRFYPGCREMSTDTNPEYRPRRPRARTQKYYILLELHKSVYQ